MCAVLQHCPTSWDWLTVGKELKLFLWTSFVSMHMYVYIHTHRYIHTRIYMHMHRCYPTLLEEISYFQLVKVV